MFCFGKTFVMTYFLLRGSKSCFPLTNLFFHVLRRMHYSTKEEKIHVFLFLLGWINARQRCSTYDRVAKWKIWQIVSLLLSKCQHIALPLKPSVSVNLYMASPHSVTDSLLGVECCLASSKVILTIWNICQHAHTHTHEAHTQLYFSISVILPIWNVCALLERSHAEYTIIVHRGIELLDRD